MSEPGRRLNIATSAQRKAHNPEVPESDWALIREALESGRITVCPEAPAANAMPASHIFRQTAKEQSAGARFLAVMRG